MAEYRGLDSFDYLLLIVRWKKILITLALFIGFISYLLIYFFIPAQYDSTSLIIPSQENQSLGISSLLKNFSDLPFDIGGLSSNSNVDMYNTVIYSRSNLEKIIEKFDLYREYGLNSMEKTIKA